MEKQRRGSYRGRGIKLCSFPRRDGEKLDSRPYAAKDQDANRSSESSSEKTTVRDSPVPGV